MEFKPGDRVRHESSYDAIVTHLGPTGPCIYWDTPASAWADNVPPEKLTLIARALYLDPAEIECLEVFADGSVELLGDHSHGVMAKMMLDIAKRAKGIA
jgi:hypothetical protein